MKKFSWFSASLILTLAMSYWFLGARLNHAQADVLHGPLPEFTQSDSQAWLNSGPLKTADLKGKVLLIDIWTLACWNCYHSFPWLHSVEEKFADDNFQVIGIHSPEFDYEHNRGAVEKAIKKYKLQHPVMMDNDFAYWQALSNRYWPAFYLVDKQGNLRYRFIGETHLGDAQADKIERAIEYLLQESL